MGVTIYCEAVTCVCVRLRHTLDAEADVVIRVATGRPRHALRRVMPD